ncbi:MAG: galactokinase [Planctomycetota bacterium]
MIVEQAISAHKSRYGALPSATGYAPGRVNLIGDHTDYSGGFVMPAALDIGCATVLGESESGHHQIFAVDLGESVTVKASVITPESVLKQPNWSRYVLGVIAEWAAEHGLPHTPAVNLAVTSRVPLGSGLSSSAALEVSVAAALDALFKLNTTPVARALLCQRAENKYAGVPCGIMDQLISSAGRFGHALLIDCRSLTFEAVALPDESKAVFAMFDSGVSHRNDSGVYADRRAACERAAGTMKIKSLRDATQQTIDESASHLDAGERNAAMHVVSENDRVLRLAQALQSGDLVVAGQCMNESHQSLSKTYQVSCEELDVLQAELCKEPRVYGARMTGGGFGGWVVALIDVSAEDPQKIVESYARGASLRLGVNIDKRVLLPSDGATGAMLQG